MVFCQVIETQERADLDHLGAFVASIEPAAASSDAAAKLHRLFQVLHGVAARYLGGNPAQGVGIIEGVSSTAEEHAAPILMNPMMRMSHGAQLEEWFYSNQALMESFQTFAHDFPTGEEPAA